MRGTLGNPTNSGHTNPYPVLACTAVVTKISYHKKRRICATIIFLNKEDWRKELEVLLKDLTSEDGSVPTNDSELAKLSLPAKVAWEKVCFGLLLKSAVRQLSAVLDSRRLPNNRDGPAQKHVGTANHRLEPR
jgi:hypothetical protein